MEPLGNTDLQIFPLNLGGNVFGYTADEAESHLVLDCFAELGGNFIDTADSYSAWAPGNSGGESESILGNWLHKRRNRDALVIATKVSDHPERRGLGAANVKAAAEDSLKRLKTDHIDLYYAHFDDPDTPLEETLGAFDELVREGKVRHVGGSNYSVERIREALEIQEREGFARWVVIQPEYNLVEREEFETGGLRDLAAAEGLAVIPHSSLAKGFLSGKYRSKDEPGDSPRAGSALSYLDDRGRRVLDALDEVAAAHGVPVAAVSIAWLNAQPTIAAALASARTIEQLEPLMAGAELELSPEEADRLDAASDPAR
jgi:aryl-alcohol dehydrogenase-like predicted oxidoreductase